MDRITILEVSHNNVMEKLDKLEENQAELQKGQGEILGKLNDFILEIKTNYITKIEAKELFSSKRAERIVFGMVGMILLAVFSKILGII